MNSPTFTSPAGLELRNQGRTVLAVPPVGRYRAYNTSAGLRIRSFDTFDSRLIPGTEANLTNPFFSPDGAWIGYWGGNGRLMKIPVAGRSSVVLCQAGNPSGASWSADGAILFGQPESIAVSIGFDRPSALVTIGTRRRPAHRWPSRGSRRASCRPT
jgi:hypothetical protein